VTFVIVLLARQIRQPRCRGRRARPLATTSAATSPGTGLRKIIGKRRNREMPALQFAHV
jgi:hypothetical protein